jgi:hypothetical protein
MPNRCSPEILRGLWLARLRLEVLERKATFCEQKVAKYFQLGCADFTANDPISKTFLRRIFQKAAAFSA